MGDLNAKLPMCSKLHKYWFAKDGYNENSQILYDFIVSNDLSVADFLFAQTVDYTYFCLGNGNYSWIDHLLYLSHDADSILSCHVVTLEEDNVGDHLKIRMEMKQPL